MAGQTTNYLFDYPTSTDYVKDGATAIETLADDVDATLFTALGGAYPGLRLVKKQTIGSGVSSVVVTGAFNSTYDNYKVMISGGVGSTTAFMRLQLGSATTDYISGLNGIIYATGAAFVQTSIVSTNFPYAGWGTTDYLGLNIDLINPNLSKRTLVSSPFLGSSVAGHTVAYHAANTSFSAFTLSPDSGTLTGGTIYVYGYGAS
jgi:hypothetical protein